MGSEIWIYVLLFYCLPVPCFQGIRGRPWSLFLSPLFSHFNSYSHFLSPSPFSPPGSSYGRLTVLLQGGNFSHLLEKTITGSHLSCTFLMTVSSCSYGQCKIKMQKNFWAINTKFIFYKLTSTAPYSSSLLSKRFQELQTKVSCYHNN